MRPLDIPEILIIVLLLAAVAWAVYNWIHPHVQAPNPGLRRRVRP